MAFTHYLPLTIPAAKVPNTDQTDFPVWVDITDVALKTIANGGHVADAQGDDIRAFSDTALTSALAFQRYSYNATTGQLRMRIKRTLTTAAATLIYLGYGDAALTTDASSTSVWNSAYKMVMPMGDGSSLDVNDKTVNANNGTVNGTIAAAAGKVYGAADIEGTGAVDYIALASNPAVNQHTIEAWANTDALSVIYEVLNFQNDGIAFRMADTAFGYGAQYSVNTNNGNQAAIRAAAISTGTWYYLVGTYDGSNIRLYVNGAIVQTTAHTGTVTSGTPSHIGIHQNASSNPFNGKVDEVKLSNTARSGDWIATSYNNENDPATFVTVGSEVAVSSGGGGGPLISGGLTKSALLQGGRLIG